MPTLNLPCTNPKALKRSPWTLYGPTIHSTDGSSDYPGSRAEASIRPTQCPAGTFSTGLAKAGPKHRVRRLHIPGKPVGYHFGLLSINYGLLWGLVVCCFRLLGFPGWDHMAEEAGKGKTREPGLHGCFYLNWGCCWPASS